MAQRGTQDAGSRFHKVITNAESLPGLNTVILHGSSCCKMFIMKKGAKLFLLCLTSVIFIGCDHATKELAKQHLKDEAPRSYYHDTFRLEYVENTGAFLNFGANWPAAVSFWAMSILPLVFLTGLFVYAIRKTATASLLTLLPFILIFSGGIGNIADRIIYNRHVTDFMNLGIKDFRTGIFNFADLYVTAGVIMLLVFQFRKPVVLKT
jgi:signal peptidase II